MQYAARLPQTKSLAGPLLALAIGAAAATGTYAILDNNDGTWSPLA